MGTRSRCCMSATSYVRAGQAHPKIDELRVWVDEIRLGLLLTLWLRVGSVGSPNFVAAGKGSQGTVESDIPDCQSS